MDTRIDFCATGEGAPLFRLMSLSRGPSDAEAVEEWPRIDLHFKEAAEEDGIRSTCCPVWIQNSQQFTGSSLPLPSPGSLPGLVGGSFGSLLKPLVFFRVFSG